MFSKLLVPPDGTPQAATALPLARTGARLTGGSVARFRAVSDSVRRHRIVRGRGLRSLAVAARN